MRALIVAALLAATPVAAQDHCGALGTIAESAFESKLRGVPLESAQLIIDRLARDNRTSERNRQRIREAVAIGYQTRTAAGARNRAIEFCRGGTL